jgi:ribosomal protein S18 acetylase RimI-like enzyme
MTTRETTFLIRPVRPDEYGPLGELTVAAFHTVGHRDTYDIQLRDVARRAETSCVLVAVGPEGELLGGVTYVRGPDDPYSENLAEGQAGMRMLAVDPGSQSRGVGRALTLACLERARLDGRRGFALHTGDWMPAAKHLYESLGFKRVQAADFSPVPGIELIGYALDLGANEPQVPLDVVDPGT